MGTTENELRAVKGCEDMSDRAFRDFRRRVSLHHGHRKRAPTGHSQMPAEQLTMLRNEFIATMAGAIEQSGVPGAIIVADETRIEEN
jgi:hypothetical protein